MVDLTRLLVYLWALGQVTTPPQPPDVENDAEDDPEDDDTEIPF